MEKHSWHRAHINLQNTIQPVPRWGHSCCVIDQQIVYFGGYAESIYMNDVWSFNTITMQWTQIKTTGDIPTQRSNCSMSYDKENNRIIVFGGGGPNKRRFNTINILDWTKKEWLEIQPKENQASPWERTYHTAQLAYPYLVVFGGEGVADMDDLWVFNFLTLDWTEIRLDKEKCRPCARRFHSSAMVGNEFFVIAGCHGKYRCLKDVYSLDLTPLLQNQSIQKLQWKQLKLQQSAFLTRWGHSSAVYNNNIYIFGGRFSNDLNDVLVLNLEKNTLKTLKTSNQLPRARRRHSACFVGSCMIIFGGFNGEYYNDLYYVNVFELKTKLQIPPSSKIKAFSQVFNKKQLSDCKVFTSEGEEFYLHKGYLINGFQTIEDMEQFTLKINGLYPKDQLQNIVQKIYEGCGHISDTQRGKNKIIIPENFESKQQNLKFLVLGEDANKLVHTLSKKKKQFGPIIELSENKFGDFLDRNRQCTYKDTTLILNGLYYLKTNKILLSTKSKYFANLFSGRYKEKNEIGIDLQHNNIVLFEILLNYLMLDLVVIPENMNYCNWMELYKLAEYFCLGRLMVICQQQICNQISEQSCHPILEFGLTNQIQTLSLSCSDYLIKCMVNKEDKYELEEVSPKMQAKDHVLEYMYGLSRFDILQVRLQRIKLLDDSLKKKESQSTTQEKENYEINYNG